MKGMKNELSEQIAMPEGDEGEMECPPQFNKN
jgi:hypothetical protein